MASKPRSLLNEVQLFLMLASTGIILGVVGISLIVLSRSMHADLRRHAIVTAGEMEAFLEYPLYAADNDQAVRIAETFLSSNTISGIVLESTANGILLSKTTGRVSRWIPKITRDIYREGLLVGKMAVTFSDEEITRTLSRFGAIALVIIIAVLLASMAAVRFVIARRVRRPFDPVFAAMKKVSEGNYEILIDPTPYRDFNIVVSLFNDMAAKIHRKNQEQKKIEESLRKSEEMYRAIVETTAEWIWEIDRNGIHTFSNPEVRTILGYNPEEIIGKTANYFLHPEDRLFVKKILDRSMGEKRGWRAMVLRWRHKDGTYRYLESNGAPILNPAGEFVGYLGADRDITERIRAEEEKDNLQAQLMQAQKMEAVAVLAGGVAHDFNNMLSAILGHAELAIMKSDPSDPVYRHLRVIEDTSLHSADLVRRMLAFARKQSVAPKVLDLNDTVAGLIKMLIRLMGEDIDLVWKPEGGLWPVKIDPSQIDQILANLCVNARDAIEGVGKVTLATENIAFDEAYCAVHAGVACGEYVMLAVSDDGCGMSKDVQDRIFEPFFTTKEPGKGTGLGLATVYGIVKQNQGFVDIYSEPGKGSTFKIYLPRSEGQIEEPLDVMDAETARGRGETVLLVDDEAVIIDVGRAMLEELGYAVLTAGVPSEAIDQAKACAATIHLLITDVVMPEMNGRDLARLLNDIKPGLKCLFTSGYTAEVIARRGELDEDVHFLHKPFSMRDLASRVREALGRE